MVKIGDSTTGGIIAWRRVFHPGMSAASEGLAALISVPMASAASPSITIASSLDIRTSVQTIAEPIFSIQTLPSAFRAISMTVGSSRNGMIDRICRRSASKRRASDSFAGAIGSSVQLEAFLSPAVVGVLGSEEVDEEALRPTNPFAQV